MSRLLVSVFSEVAAFRLALERLNQAGIRDLTTHTPVGMPELEQYLPKRGSPARFMVLAGALLGCICGFWLCIGSAYLYNLIVGGKPPKSILPYAIIGFELTILFGGLTALASILFLTRLRPSHPVGIYDPRFNIDRFGITVHCSEEQIETVRNLLLEAGAEEVNEHAASQ